jgi:hypothetical protein
MNPRLARLLTRLYPRSWRERYGEEFEAHLETGADNLRTSANVIWAALHERILPTRREDQPALSFGTIIKQPSAFLPMAMSLSALTIVLGHLATNGVGHQADEGTEAHLWQLLMAGQMPVVAFFAIRWLPRAPRQTLPVLALQAGAALASIAPVLFSPLVNRSSKLYAHDQDRDQDNGHAGPVRSRRNRSLIGIDVA